MGAAAEAVAGVIQGLNNSVLGWANYALQKNNYDYQKALQQQIFNREDTSIQRRMNDLRQAGINPNLAGGSGAGTGSVVSTSAPQINTNIGNVLDLATSVEQLKQQKELTKQAKADREIAEFNNLNKNELFKYSMAEKRANFLDWSYYLADQANTLQSNMYGENAEFYKPSDISRALLTGKNFNWVSPNGIENVGTYYRKQWQYSLDNADYLNKMLQWYDTNQIWDKLDSVLSVGSQFIPNPNKILRKGGRK